MRKEVTFTTEYIKLDSFLKLGGVAQSGGTAKFLISQGHVEVNNVVCTQRGKKLYGGETVLVNSEEYIALRMDK